MIEAACMGSILVLALGHNDYGDAATDSIYAAAFNANIDHVINYCIKYNTTLYVADFCWWVDETNPVRVALKRAALETRGTYIPLPDYLTRDNMVKGEYTAEFYQISALNMWTDGSHPNAYGHKWIAETIAKAMGLSCNSKEEALAFYDYPWPMAFDAASPFKNTYEQMPYLSYFQRVGNSIHYALNAKTKNNAVIPVANNHVVNQVPTKFVYAITAATGPYAPLMLKDTGVVSNSYSISLSLLLTISSHSTWLSTITHSGVAGIVEHTSRSI
jgi:hypothetical protein